MGVAQVARNACLAIMRQSSNPSAAKKKYLDMNVYEEIHDVQRLNMQDRWLTSLPGPYE
jgi:hypothetical protein